MGNLLEARDEVLREVFWSVRDLFSLEVDVLFIGSTSGYLELEGEDADDEEEEPGDGEEVLAGGAWG